MAQISVTGTATLLASASDGNSPCYVFLRNHGSTHVYIDSVFGGIGSSVSTSNGIILAAGDVFGFHLANGDAVYGITAGSTITVGRMRLA